MGWVGWPGKAVDTPAADVPNRQAAQVGCKTAVLGQPLVAAPEAREVQVQCLAAGGGAPLRLCGAALAHRRLLHHLRDLVLCAKYRWKKHGASVCG